MMKTKRCTIFFGILCFLCIVFAFPTAAKAGKEPKKIILNHKELTLYVGESKALEIKKIRPANASKKVKWESYDSRVATVSPNGKVTARMPGETVIWATSKKDSSVDAYVRVTVKIRGKLAPQMLALSRKEITLYVGETKELSVEKVKPAAASRKVIWKSKKKVAEVSGDGKVTAKRPGKTVITAVSKKNPKAKATVKVTVKKRPAKIEKECAFTYGIYAFPDYENLERAWPEKNRYCFHVIHTKNDFDELMRTLERNGLKNYRKTFFGEYAEMDFEKESLILYIYVKKQSESDRIEGISTKLDESGKLRGIIDYRYRSSHSSPISILYTYALVLRMEKKDAAMIDEYVLDYQEIP